MNKGGNGIDKKRNTEGMKEERVQNRRKPHLHNGK